MGGVGALRLRRAALFVLSAGVVDAGSRAECDLSVDPRGEYLHLDRAGGGGCLDVCAGAPVA